MAKATATRWKVVVGTTDLSNHAFQIDTPQEKEQIDMSGFGGTREFVPGIEDATLTITFIGDFGSNSVHNTLYPLYAGGSVFPVYVQPDAASGTSSTNPIFGGSASLYSYNGGPASLNERLEVEAEFKPAPNSTFSWGTVAI